MSESNKLPGADRRLTNLTNALYLTEGDDVAIRTGITGDIIISGTVNIPGNVTVDSTPENPVHTHLTEVGTSGTLNVPYLPIGGSVNIGTMPEVEIKNDSGNPIPVEWIYGNGATLIPWEVQVARGKITGVTSLNISGYNSSIGTSYVPLWYGNTTYTYPLSAAQMRIWSDSASDTNVSVTISGLDSNYAPLTETITLTNGATGVLTVNSFLRINTLSLSRIPMNVGNIFCGNSDKSAYYCAIEAGAGRSQQTTYTVPAGYTFYLAQSNWYTNNTGNNVGLYRSWTQTYTGIINIILEFPFPVNYTSRKTAPRAYPEKTDIQWQVQSKSGSASIGGQIEGILIANSVS